MKFLTLGKGTPVCNVFSQAVIFSTSREPDIGKITFPALYRGILRSLIIDGSE